MYLKIFASKLIHPPSGNRILIISSIIFLGYILLIILFFDPKVHIGGDDSDYIIAANKFLHNKAFPSWHGSFYPIFLSLFIRLFHLNVVILKSISVLLCMIHFWIFYSTFRSEIKENIFLFSLLLLSVCYPLLFYSGTTYSEPLFMFIQILIMLFLKKYICLNQNKRNSYLTIALLSGLIFLLGITRNVGLGAIIAFGAFLLIRKEYKPLMLTLLVFFLCHFLFGVYKSTSWNVQQVGFESQFQNIALKNFYDPTAGKENLQGYVKRAGQNANLYFSKHLMRMYGLGSYKVQTVKPWITILITGILLFSVFIHFKQAPLLFFITLYCITLLGVTFVTQQTHWDQERLIAVYFPLLTVLFLVLLDYAILKLNISKPDRVVTAILAFITVLSLLTTLGRPKQIVYLIENLSDNKYRGYPVEWENYAKLCEWTGKNISEENRILCRKPGIAEVYGNRDFVGISKFPYTVPDSAVNYIKQKNIDYVVLDNAIQTVSRLLSLYLQKNNLGLSLVKQEGNLQPAYLLKINNQTPITDQDWLDRIHAGIAVYPKHAFYYSYGGNLHFDRKQYKKAIQYYTQALQFEPNNAAILANRGVSYYFTNNQEASKQDIDKAIKNIKGDKGILNSLLQFFRQTHQINELKEIEKLLVK